LTHWGKQPEAKTHTLAYASARIMCFNDVKVHISNFLFDK